MKLLRIYKVVIILLVCSTAVFAEERQNEARKCNLKQKDAIRVVSYNIMKFEGYPKAAIMAQRCPRFESNEAIFKRVRKQIPLRIALELALYKPSIITLQEAVDQEKVKEIAGYLGMDYVFFPGNGRWPGAVITKYKILQSQQNPVADGNCSKELFTRHWGRVVLDTEMGNVVLHTAHLNPVDKSIHKREVTGILKVIKEDMDAGGSILFQGDLNHEDDAPAYQRWVDAGLIDSFAKKGSGLPFTANSADPKRRIDYIWLYGQIEKYLVENKTLAEGAFRLCAKKPESFVLSDHMPVLAVFQRSIDE